MRASAFYRRMIQRIQTLYLLVAVALLAGVTLFDDVWGGAAAASQPWLPTATLVLVGVAVLLAVGALLMYKRRKRQYALVGWAQWATLALIVVLLAGLLLADALSASLAAGDYGALWALVLPVVAYVMLLLARRGVKSDIDLVRSMDRLR